ncbi:MAG: hypothetical protein IKH23_05590 [Clostridiales bacterium]|nr:hypothetical protein [Clostridiales bacterium]
MRYSATVLIIYFAQLLPVFAGIALLVLGIMIAAGKEKSLRVLGIGYIVKAVPAIMSAVSTLVIRTVSAKVFASFSVGTSYISIICSTGFLVCVCFFVHKNYGKKLIYIPVLAVHIGGLIVSRVVTLLLVNVINTRKNYTAWISMTNLINSFVVDAAVAVIIIIVFYMNRKNEKVIPLAWLGEVIILAASTFRTLIYIGYYLAVINHTRLRQISDTMMTLFFGVISLAVVATPLYITVMAYKRKNAPAAVPAAAPAAAPVTTPAAAPEAVTEPAKQPDQL